MQGDITMTEPRTRPPQPANWADGLRAVLLANWLRWPYVAALLAAGAYCLHGLGAKYPGMADLARACGIGFIALGVLAAASRSVVVHLLVHVAAGVLLGLALLYPAWTLLQSLGMPHP